VKDTNETSEESVPVPVYCEACNSSYRVWVMFQSQ
jgi:hypothetical protein